ncbi:hypothetical protein T439DRAFT_345792 [Meredithblackwellia eburnea MCA 4105]
MTSKKLRLWLEPPPVVAPSKSNTHDDIFARPLRLHDIQDDGTEVFSREDPDRNISERLTRIWAERGDFSALSSASILAGKSEEENKDADGKDKDARPSPQDIRDLSMSLMEQLEVARGELTTALDLLSVLAPPTDPPSVDVASLPFPQQTLKVVQARPAPPPPSDSSSNPLASLGIATSLSSLRSTANTFFRASDELSGTSTAPSTVPADEVLSRTPRERRNNNKTDTNIWPDLLRLRLESSHNLLPLGASRGASLTGKGGARAARDVGVFFGCPEARESFRQGAMSRVGDLVGQETVQTGRAMVLSLEMGEEKESTLWAPTLDDPTEIAEILKARGRSAFAEEIFATLSNEARTDSTLKASLTRGKRKEGDSILVDGHGWCLKISMMPTGEAGSTTKLPPSQGATAAAILPLLRLLFLQEYAQRRAPPATLLWTRPILQTLSTLLSHVQRRVALQAMLTKVALDLNQGGLDTELEYWASSVSAVPSAGADLAESVVRILKGDKELGGLVVFRVARTRIFHVTHSLILPQPGPQTASPQTLMLQFPGGSGPVAIPSLPHLEMFLADQCATIRKAKAAGAAQKAA